LAESDSLRGGLSAVRGVRELIVLAAALAVGLVIAPLLTWFAGARELGAYAGGGLQAFMTHFYRELGDAAPGFWIVALAPYVITQLARGLLRWARG
jgi:hypothetical protein